MSLTFGSRGGTGLLVRSVPAVVVVPLPDPPTIVAVAQSASGVSATGTSKPTGTAEGDDLYALVACNTAPAPLTASGWTTVATITGVVPWGRLLYKRAGGSEPSSYSFADGDESVSGIATIIVTIRGANVASPLGDSATNTVASGTSHVSGEVTPVAGNSLLLMLVAAGGSGREWTEPDGMDEDLDTPNVWSRGAFSEVLASTDPVTRTATLSSGSSGVSAVLVLTPAG